jgi:hypothetical protein
MLVVQRMNFPFISALRSPISALGAQISSLSSLFFAPRSLLLALCSLLLVPSSILLAQTQEPRLVLPVGHTDWVSSAVFSPGC